ncbi:hypothetical protein ACVWVY_000040 [Bradyrhizobium sp. URHC0002]
MPLARSESSAERTKATSLPMVWLATSDTTLMPLSGENDAHPDRQKPEVSSKAMIRVRHIERMLMAVPAGAWG